VADPEFDAPNRTDVSEFAHRISRASRLALLVSGGLFCACGQSEDPDTAPGSAIDSLVERLGDLPATLGPQIIRSDGRPIEAELRRAGLYAELYAYSEPGVIALGRGLHHDDVKVRRNAALALFAFGFGYSGWGDHPLPPADLSPALADLELALTDDDARVRASAASALYFIGAGAVSAVPALIEMLGSENDGDRFTACGALRGIGPAAESALPALRLLSAASNEKLRDQARMAIDSIEGH
jgi:hypothetical protein